jgi:hypothetical protein
MRDLLAVVANVVVTMMIVMAMDADTYANTTNMDADYGSVRRAGT